MKKNEGINLSGGNINAENLAVGKNAKIEQNRKKSLDNDSESVPDKEAVIKSITQLISSDKLEEAISNLTDYFEEQGEKTLLFEVVGLSARLNYFQTEKHKGSTREEDLSLELNRIRMALLNILKQMEN